MVKTKLSKSLLVGMAVVMLSTSAVDALQPITANAAAKRSGNVATDTKSFEISASDYEAYQKGNKSLDSLIPKKDKIINYDSGGYIGDLKPDKITKVTEGDVTPRATKKVKATSKNGDFNWSVARPEPLGEPIKSTAASKGKVYAKDPYTGKEISGNGSFSGWTRTLDKTESWTSTVNNSNQYLAKDKANTTKLRDGTQIRDIEINRRLGYLSNNNKTYPGTVSPRDTSRFNYNKHPSEAYTKPKGKTLNDWLYGEAMDYAVDSGLVSSVNYIERTGGLDYPEVKQLIDTFEPRGWSGTLWSARSVNDQMISLNVNKKRRENLVINNAFADHNGSITLGNQFRRGIQVYYKFKPVKHYKYKPQYEGTLTAVREKKVNTYNVTVEYKGNVYAAPTAHLTVNPKAGNRFDNVRTLDASGSTDPQNAKLTYEFSYKKTDGKDSGTLPKSNKSTIKHEFNYVGDYEITVKVTNEHGRTDTTKTMISVENIDPDRGFTVTDNLNQTEEDKLEGFEIYQPIYIVNNAFDKDGEFDSQDLFVRYDVTAHYADDETRTITLTSEDGYGTGNKKANHFVVNKEFLDKLRKNRDDVTSLTVSQQVQDYPQTGPKNNDYRTGRTFTPIVKDVSIEDVSIKGNVGHTDRMKEVHEERNTEGVFYFGEEFILTSETSSLQEFSNVKVRIVTGDPTDRWTEKGRYYNMSKSSTGHETEQWGIDINSDVFWSSHREDLVKAAQDQTPIYFEFEGVSKYGVKRNDLVQVNLSNESMTDVFDMNNAFGNNQ